ncbi:MAG: transglycosylase family protein [Microthrixaceae bacterium]
MQTVTAPTHRSSLAICALLLSIAVLAPVVPSQAGAVPTGAAAAADGGIGAAQAKLDSARARRQEAETRLAEASANKAAVEAQLRSLEDGAARITQDLAEARAQVREYAVKAYIDGGQSAIVGAALDPSESTEAAWHTQLTASRTLETAEAVDRYDALKRANDPERVAAAARLDEATALVDTAQSDAIQAAAYERDAEAELTRLREAQAEAQRRAAAALEQAARDATAREQAAAVRSKAQGERPRATAEPTAAPRPQSSPSPPVPAPSPAPSGGASPGAGGPTAAESAQLAKIRRCESRGNYSIVSSSGRYRGAYQFDTRTWAAVGGSGDPAAASPAEQDYRALLLLRQRGTRPWPNCH